MIGERFHLGVPIQIIVEERQHLAGRLQLGGGHMRKRPGHRGFDSALFHRRNGGSAEPDADHADGIRIDAVLAQNVFQKVVGR